MWLSGWPTARSGNAVRVSEEQRARISRAIDALDAATLSDYADAPVPAPLDESIGEIVGLLAELTLGEREQILWTWFESEQLQALSVFSMRMCGLAVAERSEDLFLTAMIAQALEGFRSIEDERVADVVLETLRETAETLGVDPAPTAAAAATLAPPEAGERLRAFFAPSEPASR